jgi:hypothetical protein
MSRLPSVAGTASLIADPARAAMLTALVRRARAAGRGTRLLRRDNATNREFAPREVD